MRCLFRFLWVCLFCTLVSSCVVDTVVDSRITQADDAVIPADGMHLVVVHCDSVFSPPIGAGSGAIYWGDGSSSSLRRVSPHRYTTGGWHCVTTTLRYTDTVTVAGLGGVSTLTVCLP